MSLNVQPGVIPSWDVRDRFRKARETRGVSQSEMADLIGLSRRTISSIESGEKKPGRKDYLLWQMATGVPASWLETGEAPHDGAPDGGGGEWAPWGSNPRPADYRVGASPVIRLPQRMMAA